MGSSAWFESWDSLYKILISTLVGYALLILLFAFSENDRPRR